MIPFQKLFTILIRTFSRPMLAYLKRKQQQKKLIFFGSFFVGVGRRSFALQSWMNYRFLKRDQQKQNRDLKPQILLEKGIQAFYEFFFYLIVLGLPFYEMYKNSIAAQKKQQTLQHRILSLQKKMDQINQKIVKVVDLAKQKARQSRERESLQAKKYQKLSKEHDRRSLQQRMNSLTQSSSKEDVQLAQKIQQMFQNALDVMADQFQDSLDQMQFSSSSNDVEVAEAMVGSTTQMQNDVSSQVDASDSTVQSLQGNIQLSTTDLFQGSDVQVDEPVLNIDPLIEIDIDTNDVMLDVNQ